MIYDIYRQRATPRSKSTCPSCGNALIAKCGSLVTWHWAHKASECDAWSEPESAWHISWKEHFEEQFGAQTEQVMGPHRADIVIDGQVIELQYGFLSADEIAEREAFYGPSMAWIYRCTWHERLHFGRRGFWWKHGSKAMTTHRTSVLWDMGTTLWQVRLNLVYDEYSDSERVVGKAIKQHQFSWMYPALTSPNGTHR